MSAADIDRGKLARLQMDLIAMNASVRGLSALSQDVRDGLATAENDLQRHSRFTESNFRPGDDLGFLLNMPADERAGKGLGAAYLLAQRIVAARAELAAVSARIAELEPRRSALAALVRRCEEYAATQGAQA